MKKEEILPFGTTQMNLEGITLNKISWAKTDKKMYDLTFVEAKKGKLIDKWSKKIVVVWCCGERK